MDPSGQERARNDFLRHSSLDEKAVVRTFDHPYFTVSDIHGRFDITAPAGARVIHYKHSRLGEQTRNIQVPAGQHGRLRPAVEL